MKRLLETPMRSAVTLLIFFAVVWGEFGTWSAVAAAIIGFLISGFALDALLGSPIVWRWAERSVTKDIGSGAERHLLHLILACSYLGAVAYVLFGMPVVTIFADSAIVPGFILGLATGCVASMTQFIDAVCVTASLQRLKWMRGEMLIGTDWVAKAPLPNALMGSSMHFAAGNRLRASGDWRRTGASAA